MSVSGMWRVLAVVVLGGVASWAEDTNGPGSLDALRSEIRAHDETVRATLNSVTNEVPTLAARVDAARAAVNADTNSAAAWAELGAACWADKRGIDARAACERAIALDSKLAGAWLTRGQVLEASGRVDNALQDYSSAVAQDATLWEGWAGRGRCLQELERMEEAAVAFRQAVALSPTNGVLQVNLAVCLDLSGSLTAAEAAFREAVRLASDPSQPWTGPGSTRADAWLKLGIFLERRERAGEVVALYRDGTRRCPDSAPLWRALGEALNGRLQFDEADAALQQAREIEVREIEVRDKAGSTAR